MSQETAAVDYRGLDNSILAGLNSDRRRWRSSNSISSCQSSTTGSKDTRNKEKRTVERHDTDHASGKVALKDLRRRRASNFVRFRYPVQFHAPRAKGGGRQEHLPPSLRTTSLLRNQPCRLRCQYIPSSSSTSQVRNHKIQSRPLPVNKLVASKQIRDDAEETSDREESNQTDESSEADDETNEDERDRNAHYKFVYQGGERKEASQSEEKKRVGEEKKQGKPTSVYQADSSEDGYTEEEVEDVYSDDFDEENDEFEAAASSVIKAHTESHPRPQSGRPESRKSGARPTSALRLQPAGRGPSVKFADQQVPQQVYESVSEPASSDDELGRRLDKLLQD